MKPQTRPALHVVASLAAIALASGCTRGVLDPQGPVGRAEKTMMFNSLGIMLAVVIPVILATIGFAWWFRASNPRATRRPSWSYSGQIEMIVWAVPAMVVLLLGGLTWVGAHDLDPPRPLASTTPAVKVDVVSLDWKWLFIYPDLGVASVNRLVIPVGTPISFRLTSATVMNSFFVPQLGSQIYTMAGMTTHLNLLADQVGHYDGISAQISGLGFSDMRFDVDARTPDEFTAWASSAHARGERLDSERFADLAKPSVAVAPVEFSSVASDLFESIVKPQTTSASPPGAR